MQDEALQAAFEIKAACDEISRRLLRWHWEQQKPGPHSLDALFKHIAQRQKESPEYYDRMPDLSSKTSWQQLDTTLCMRVLLDPEKDAAQPLDLLGDTARPGAARHACNAVRTARNEAAHASDATAAAQAAIRFNEAVEALEEGYAGTVFRENELAQYYRDAEDFLSRCGAGKPIEPQARKTERKPAAKSAAKTTTRSSTGKRSTGQTKRKTSAGTGTRRKTKAQKAANSRAIVLGLLVVFVLGLLLRGCSMGLL